MSIFKWMLWFILLAYLGCRAEAVETPIVQSFAGRSINLVVPQGYCAIGDGTEQEREWHRVQTIINAGRNKAILDFADCTQLAKFIDDQNYRIRDYGGYLISLSPRAVYPLDYPRAEFLATVPRQIRKVDPKLIEEELNEKFKDAGIGPTVKEATLGIVETNADAAFLVTGGFVEDAGQRTRKIVVTAITLAKGLFISIHLCSDYRNQETFLQLLVAQRRLAAEFVAANI